MCHGASHVPPMLHQGRSISGKEQKLLSRIRHFRHSVCAVAHGAGRHTPFDRQIGTLCLIGTLRLLA